MPTREQILHKLSKQFFVATFAFSFENSSKCYFFNFLIDFLRCFSSSLVDEESLSLDELLDPLELDDEEPLLLELPLLLLDDPLLLSLPLLLESLSLLLSPLLLLLLLPLCFFSFFFDKAALEPSALLKFKCLVTINQIKKKHS